jgi:hypothetical protein
MEKTEDLSGLAPIQSGTGNVNDWARALRNDYPELASQLDEDRYEGFKNVEAIGLPHYRIEMLPLGEFLESPEEYFIALESQKFFVSLKPKKEELRRYGKAGLDQNEVLAFIEEHISSEHIADYDVAIGQYINNLFGGTIMVSEKGDVYFEFKRGNHQPVAKGSAESLFVAFRDSFGHFKYSFEDGDIKKAAYDTILAIPHTGDGREMKFLPGYYEVAITKQDASDELRPYFLDYKDNTVHQFSPVQENIKNWGQL